MTSPHGRKALRCPKMPAATGANGRPRACSHPTKRIGPSGPFGGPIPKHPGGKMGNPRSSSINRNGRFGFQQIRRADLRRQGNEAPNLDPKVPKITIRPQRGRVRKVPQVAPHGTRTHLLRQSESDQPSCEGELWVGGAGAFRQGSKAVPAKKYGLAAESEAIGALSWLSDPGRS